VELLLPWNKLHPYHTSVWSRIPFPMEDNRCRGYQQILCYRHNDWVKRIRSGCLYHTRGCRVEGQRVACRAIEKKGVIWQLMVQNASDAKSSFILLLVIEINLESPCRILVLYIIFRQPFYSNHILKHI